MRFISIFLLFFIFINAFGSELDLTEEERAWIEKSSTITLGADYKWPPFDFADAKGKHVGLAADYLELIAKKTGLKFDVIPDRWATVIQNMKAKKYYGLACAVKTDERKKYLLFTEPYLSVPMVIITKTDNKEIKNFDDLAGKVVSINKGSYVHEWLETKYPKIKLHLSSSNEESIQAVSHGKADAYFGNLAVATYIMNTYLINNLQIVSAAEGFSTEVSIAIDKEHYILLNIIQKALSSISEKEHQTIKSKWKENLSLDKKASLLSFTQKQQAWIEKHKKIRYVIDNAWLPLEYLDSETQLHSGITKSYLDIVSKRTGLEFELVKTETWSQAAEKINKREADLYSAVSKTKDRSKVVNFSIPYIKMPEVYVTKKEISLVRDIHDLYYKKVALVKGYSITGIIKEEHPLIDVIEVETVSQALELVTQGKAYAYMDVLPIVSYYIQKKGFSNLKISGMSNYTFEFSMALRNDYAKEGIEVLNKALKSISEEDKNNIYNKWLRVEYDKEIDYTVIWQITGLFLFFLIGTIYWNRKLANEVYMRKMAQEELVKLNIELEKANDIAQSASRAKSNFLSNMSHEIRTPMNSILGFADLLYEKIEDKKLKSYISTIRSSGQALLFLINDILDLSKIESGKLEIVKKASNVKNLFEEVKNLFILQIEQKGLSFSIKIDEDMPSSLIVDAVRLKEILINLVGNALKFTEDGGIYIQLKVDAIYDHKSKIDLRVFVKDTGIGIPKESQEKIFNTFEQVENQDMRRYGGTGLGLAISKKLAQLMGGSLEVQSKEGEGSTFILCLKNIDIASLSQESEERENFDYHDICFAIAKLLVVDDVKENRELIKESFSETNIEIFEATNGQEAIDKARENNFDLILMDIRMPIMDGYNATRLIKKFSSTPIVALTASIMQEELQKIESERFAGYLRKPVTKQELYEMLTKYIKFSTKSNKQKEELINPFHKNIDKEQLRDFSMQLEREKVSQLYQKAILTNDLALIEEFANRLYEIAKVHNIEVFIDYCKNLFDDIDVFDINEIISLLKKYPQMIEEIQEKL